jgi:4-hydroxy-tetrahydrodipicolinate reductase
MGAAAAELICRQPDMRLQAGIEAFGHPSLGSPFGAGVIGSDLNAVIGDCDVVVDFSSPKSSLASLGIAARHSRSYILGTTGFSAEELAEVRKFSQSLPLVFAPNFSTGVNVLCDLVERAAGMLGAEYDIEIVEVHHRRKKDAPSGTALRLREAVARATGRDLVVHGRQGMVGEKPANEIGIHSVRTGDVVGEHTVILSTEGERLELVHRAHSRLAFAQGVVRAIRFIQGKPNGMFGMNDVLGLAAGRAEP